MRPITNQTILITGATDGHRRALAAKLASAGATVLIHGRDDARDHETIDDLRTRTGNEKLRFLRADFASLDEIRAFAEQVLADYDRLDALVNNAGIGTTSEGHTRRQESRDGHELRFAVNYLAGYLLTRMLLPLLERSAPALERHYDGVQAYCQSKLAQIMFTLDLAEELNERGLTTNCLHPATYMPTKIVLSDGIRPSSSLEQGVQATLRLVTDPDLDGVSGRYFNGTHVANPHPQAHDREARRKLRELSDRLCALATTERTAT